MRTVIAFGLANSRVLRKGKETRLLSSPRRRDPVTPAITMRIDRGYWVRVSSLRSVARDDRDNHAAAIRNRPRRSRRNRPLAWLSRRRAAHVAKNAGSLCARRRPIPRFSRRASRRTAVAESAGQAHAADVRAFMAARRADGLEQPLADAGVGGHALVRALSGAQRQRQSRCACVPCVRPRSAKLCQSR